ncbi:MAG: hypothetical protein FD169_2328 [Bacillota bacterium]|nr:MAG: hypothetical protein FD169_2328 [Bacillota bacterium]
MRLQSRRSFTLLVAIILIVVTRITTYVLPPILSKDLDRYQSEQTKTAKSYLVERLAVPPDTIQSRGGGQLPGIVSVPLRCSLR